MLTIPPSATLNLTGVGNVSVTNAGGQTYVSGTSQLLGIYQSKYMVPAGDSTTNWSVVGLNVQSTGTSINIAASVNNSLLIRIATLANPLSGFQAARYWNSTSEFFENNPVFIARAGVSSLSSGQLRSWIGMFDVPPNQVENYGNSLGQQNASFRYSTLAGDTNWMCCCGTGAANSFSAYNSNVPIDGRIHTFQIDVTSGTSIVWRIDNNIVAATNSGVPNGAIRGYIGVHTIATGITGASIDIQSVAMHCR